MQKNIYAVYDRVAQDIVGLLMTYNHDAPAVRVFTDGLADPTTLGRHPADFDLVILAQIDTSRPSLIGDGVTTVVLSGAVWAASQPDQER